MKMIKLSLELTGFLFEASGKDDIKLESVLFSVSEIQYSCFKEVQANGAILVPQENNV